MSYPTCRPMNSTELAAVATGISTIEGQGTRIRAIIVPQQTILSCQCSGSLVSNDAVTNIPMSVLSGTVAHVANGMTGYVGSSTGARNLGMIRVKSATSSSIHCGRVSGINWSTSVYITIVDDFGIWAKLPSFDLSIPMMDDDIVYSDQNTNMYPVPILGPDRALSFTSGCALLDGSNSYTLDGTSIVSYAWSVTNVGTSSGSLVSPTSASSVWIPAQTGSYILALTVTSSNGKSTIGHRNLYIYDESGSYVPQANITLENITMERDAGGATAKIKAWEGIDISTVPDRSKVILIADEFYGGSALNIGQVPGCEKTLFVGWMSTEMDEYDRNVSSGDFDLAGPHYWLQKCAGPSTYLESMTTVTSWLSFTNLSVDKTLYHFLMWRSTAMEVMDCYPSGNTRYSGGVSMGIDSIWAQLKNSLWTRWLTYMVCDRYGRFMPYLNPQLQANRSSIPNVQTWTRDDFGETIKFNRTVIPPVSLLEVAGLTGGADNTDPTMFMSRAPGTLIYGRYGDNDMNDSLIVNDQADANYLSGALLAWKNNIYASIGLVLAENNKMLDVAPAMYATMSAAPSDSIGGRGVTLTNLRVLFSRLVYRVDDKGAVSIEVDCEGETTGIDGYTVVQPQEPISNLPPTSGSGSQMTIPIVPLVTPGSWWPPVIPNVPTGTPTNCLADDQPTGPFNLTFDMASINPGDTSYAWCHCWIRKNSSSNRSFINLYISESTFTVDAIDASKNVIMAGIVDDRDPYGFYPISFDNTNDTEVWGFKITASGNVQSSDDIWINLATGINTSWLYGDTPNKGFSIGSGWRNMPNNEFRGVLYLIHQIIQNLDGGIWYSTGGFTGTDCNWGGDNRTKITRFFVDATIADNHVDDLNAIAAYFSDYINGGIFKPNGSSGSFLTDVTYAGLFMKTGEVKYGYVSYGQIIAYPVYRGVVPSNAAIILNGPQPIYNICGVSS